MKVVRSLASRTGRLYPQVIIEIHSMWNVKTKMVAVIIGTTGTTSKSRRKYLSNIPGKRDIKGLQRRA
jgi:hypothetical protein